MDPLSSINPKNPIGPKTHGAIDYAFVAAQTLAPTLFNLKGPAKTLCYTFAAGQGLLNAITDQPLAIKKAVPFKMHGQLEIPFLPALLALPWITGAFKQRNARFYFPAFFAIALTHFLLTDYRVQDRIVPTPDHP